MKRSKRAKVGSGTWGLVLVAIETVGEPPLWSGHWMQLGAPFQISVEIDADPDQNISFAAWRRARQAFGVPARIVVLDEETAERVRRVVPRMVTVSVEEEPRLRSLVEGCKEIVEHTASEPSPWGARRRGGALGPH
jgi:hypothetical protein